MGPRPEGGEGIADLPRVVAEGQKATPADPRLYLLFARTDSSQRAGRAFIERQRQRTADRDPDSSTETIAAQQAAIVRWGGSPGPAASARLGRISHPALVVNGKTDVMVPSVNSIALFHGLPNAKLILYPDSGHGALFQHGDAFVREGDQFLDS